MAHFRRWTTPLVVCSMGVTLGSAQSLGVREAALARITLATSVASDRVIVEAVQQKNSSGESLADIEAKDRQWATDPSYALRVELSQNACAERLRELIGRDSHVVEAIVMDANGANVCSDRPTTDYWQGDEAKFQKTYGEDRGAFVDQPSFDESTGTYEVQLSVLLKDSSGHKAGAVTLGMQVHESEVAQR